MPPWSLQNSKNWLFFSHVEKKLPKKNYFLCRATHKNISFFRFIYPGTLNFVLSSNPCTRVHDVLFFLQIHVPGYMMFCFFFKSMYPGTWNFDFSSNPCTPVHGIQIFFIILMCSSGGGGGPVQKSIFFLAIFFNMWKN